MRFANYHTGTFFDEMFEAGGAPRAAARSLVQLLETMTDGELLRRQQSAERALLHMGITFNVYGDSAGTERIFPFDLIPRIVAAAEWNLIERGLKQRIRALNLFIDDVYHDQKIVKDGIIPAELISERLDEAGAASTLPWPAFAERHADLLAWNPSILERYYRPETLWSERARRTFVMPDRLA